MATKVQTKTYFPGSMMDLNKGLCNGMWDLYHDDSEKNQCYESFLMSQTIDGYAKEQMRQTILKQESIFRHQLQELHRLYKRQRDLMNEFTMKERYSFSMPTEAPKPNHFLSQVPSRVSMHSPHVESTFGGMFSPLYPLKGKCTLNDFGPLSSKSSSTQRRVIDLEQPADVDDDNEGKRLVENVCNLREERGYSLADLNEPLQVEEAPFAASFNNKNSDHSVMEKLQKQDLSANPNSRLLYLSKSSQQDNFADGKTKCYENGYSNGIFSHQSNLLHTEPKKSLEISSRKRTLFGVELCERNHSPSFDSSQSSSRDQNTSTLHHNHWLSSTDASRQIPEYFVANKRVNTNNSHSRSGIAYENDVQKTQENRLPPWLMAKSSLGNEQMKGKETTIYQMNLDSLQHHSQQFFKKADMAKVNDSQGITKILGVPIVDNSKDLIKENDKINLNSDLMHHIDLNLSFEEEEETPLSTPHIPESVVKVASMEIDLEAPAVSESETPSNFPLDDVSVEVNEVAKDAAEAIIAMSSSELPPPQQLSSSDTLLRWFAEVIESGDNIEKDSGNVNKECIIPDGMDDFEYMTLKLEETKEELYYCNKPMIVEEKEEDESLLRKRTTRKGQGKRGRQRKDFQRDVLPGIISLSRREVTEDLQTFEEAFTGIGVSWQSSMSKRKAAGKNGRGRRRLVVSSPSPPPVSPPAAVEQSVCREVALEEKSLSGWGKRTRRLPRQRCQNGGSHQSLALKC